MSKVLKLLFAQHCEACPHCGAAIWFITESQSVYCRNCHRIITIHNGTLIG